MISATISPCAMARWASIGSPVTSPTAQTLRIEVAERSSTRMNGPAMARSRLSRPKPSVRGRRPTATRTLSAAIVFSAPSAPATPQRALGEAERPRADHDLDAEIGGAARDRLGQFLVVERQDFRQRLDDRHLRAELGEGHAELHADIARADHGERLGNLGQRQRLGRGEDVLAVERQRGERRRLRAGGDDEMLAGDLLVAGVGVGDRALAVERWSRGRVSSAPPPS